MTWHATIIVLFVVLVAGGVGLPFPEDLTLLGAGALAQPGLLRLTDVVLAGFFGVVRRTGSSTASAGATARRSSATRASGACSGCTASMPCAAR